MPTKSRVYSVPRWGVNGGDGLISLYSGIKTPCPPPSYEEEGEETITYENGNRSQPHPCEHTANWKATRLFSETGFSPGGIPYWDYSWETTNPWTVDVTHGAYLHRVPNSPWSVPRSQLLETAPNVDVLIADSLGRLNAGCRESVFALPRAVVELRDVPRTIKSFLTLAQWSTGLVTGARYGNRILPRNTPRELRGKSAGYITAWFANQTASKVAGTYLATVFGVKPTKKDINTFLGRPDDARRPLKLAVTQPKLYKGQRLESKFRLGPQSSLFPSFGIINLNYKVGLLRDWHSSNGLLERLSIYQMAWQPYHGIVHHGCAFGEVVGLPTRDDWTYGEQLALSGGGPLATAWELYRYTWILDSVFNIGKAIAQAERKGLPLELRPTLRFGSWISHRKSISYFLPKYQAIDCGYHISQYPDPSTGLGGEVTNTGILVPLGYKEAFRSALVYSRYKSTGAFDELGMPTLRKPGGFIKGTLAALAVQLATSKITQNMLK